MFDNDDSDLIDAGEANNGHCGSNIGCGTALFLIIVAIAFIVFGWWLLGKMHSAW